MSAGEVAPPPEAVVAERNALIAKVKLRSVQLMNLFTELTPSGPDQDEVELNLTVDGPSYRSELLREQSLLYCGVRFRLTLGANSESDPVLEVRAEYTLFYDLVEDVECSGDGVQLFAAQNAVFNAWPFFREVTHSVACRMGLPNVVVPLLRLPPMPPTGGSKER